MNNNRINNKHNLIFGLVILMLSLLFITLICLYFMFWHDQPNETYPSSESLTATMETDTADTYTYETAETHETETYETETYETETYETTESTVVPPTTSEEIETSEKIPYISILDLESITFTDSDGNKQLFNILGSIEYNEEFYIALLSAETEDKTQYIAFKIEQQDDSENLVPIVSNDDTKTIFDKLEEMIFGASPKDEIVYKKVDDSYFEDALFVGDSMIETFIRYSNVKTNSYFYRGVMVNNILTKRFIEIDSEMYTLEEAFQKNPNYKKIYLMFGTNEQGWKFHNLFKEYYKTLIDLVRKNYPEAVIYVMSTFPVAHKAENRTDAVYSNEVASLFRTYESELCEEYKGQKVYYLDVASIMTGEDGYLLEGVSLDGVHPTLKYTGIWREYLKEHAIDEEKSI